METLLFAGGPAHGQRRDVPLHHDRLYVNPLRSDQALYVRERVWLDGAWVDHMIHEPTWIPPGPARDAKLAQLVASALRG